MLKALAIGLCTLLFCVGNLLCLPAMGQEYVLETKRIEFEEGLASRSIQFFFEDSRGFMWFGSQAGLNRYDGNRVEKFTTDNGLLSNRVGQMGEDDQGQFWIWGRAPGTSAPVIQVFDPLLGRAQTLTSYLRIPLPFQESEVIGLGSHLDSPHLFVLLKNSTIYQYSENQFTLFWAGIETGDLPNIRSAHYGEKSVWVSDLKQMVQVKGPNQADTLVYPPDGLLGPRAIGKGDELIYNIFSGIPKEGSTTHSYLLHSGKLLYKEGKNIMNNKRLVGIDAYHRLIWARDSVTGLAHVFDTDFNEVTAFKPHLTIYSRPNYPKFNSKGIAWLNRSGGVLMLRIKQRKFRNYLTGMQVFGQKGYGARGLLIEGDSLYSNGLGPSFKTSLTSGQSREFGPSPEFYRGGGGDQGTLKRLALLKNQEGNLWYTDEAIRVARFDRQSDEFTDYTYKQEVRSNAARRGHDIHVHWSAYQDHKGTLWLGRRRGLAYLKKESSHLNSFDAYEGFEELGKASIFAFHENSEGLWVGATTGLYLMKDEKIVKRLFYDKDHPEVSLPANEIVHIREDSTGAFWLASRGGGIVKLLPNRQTYQQWTTTHGLSDNVVYATYEDDFGYIWASSNQGIMRIRKADMTVSIFKKAQGLIHDEFNTTSHYQADDGRICFGSIDGVTCFNPRDFVEETDYMQEVHWTGLKKQSRSDGRYKSSREGIFDKDQITIRPGELGFTLDFTLLNYFGDAQGSFAYMIEGLDADWNYISDPIVRVSALPYGSFDLKVKGQGTSGYWTAPRSITLQVIRPIYLRGWFLTLMVLTIATIVLLLIRQRIGNLKKVQLRLESQVKQRTKQISEQAEELKELDKLKSKFFANVSHELRTPLSLIKGPVDQLINQHDLTDAARIELGRIQRNSNKIAQMVEELLDLARLENGRIEPRHEAVNIHQFFSRFYTSFESKARLEEINFQYHYPGDPEASFNLDPSMVEKILNNLLSNAFKFTPRKGQITLNVDLIENELEVTVQDTGTGISEKDLPYVFDRFFQTKDGSKDASGGTGIGLALSRELADTMNAQLTVTSSVGQGSTFKLVLVTHSVAALSHISPVDKPNLDTELPKDIVLEKNKRYRVMLVEDHADMRAFLADSLSQEFHIAEARDGRDALKKLLSESRIPDVIISDMMMPEMTGLEFLEALKKEKTLAEVPVLMLTARSAEKDKLAAFKLGVNDYLIKPFSVEELRARIRNLLRMAESRKVARLSADPGTDEQGGHESRTEQWLVKLTEIVQENVHKVDFNIRSVAEMLGLSERQFQRNLKKTTGLTPTVYLKEIRLQMARKYLEEGKYEQVSEVSNAVGFTATPYFSKMFKERFGKLPSSYFFDGQTGTSET